MSKWSSIQKQNKKQKKTNKKKSWDSKLLFCFSFYIKKLNISPECIFSHWPHCCICICLPWSMCLWNEVAVKFSVLLEKPAYILNCWQFYEKLSPAGSPLPCPGDLEWKWRSLQLANCQVQQQLESKYSSTYCFLWVTFSRNKMDMRSIRTKWPSSYQMSSLSTGIFARKWSQI